MGDHLELVGLTDMGEEGNLLRTIKDGEHRQQPGTHVLQIMFQGISGFRFPFVHFVSRQVNASDLYILMWEAIDKLRCYDFSVKYICMDGACSNRSFMHLHFPNKNLIEMKMTAKSPINPEKEVIFMMDPSHCFKKIRNGLKKL